MNARTSIWRFLDSQFRIPCICAGKDWSFNCAACGGKGYLTDGVPANDKQPVDYIERTHDDPNTWGRE